MGLFGPPIWPKNLKIRPLGYFFMLNSILKLPDLEIPLKSQKIQNFRFSLLCKIEKSKVFELRSNISGRPLGDRKLHAKNSDSQPPGGPGAPGIAKIAPNFFLGSLARKKKNRPRWPQSPWRAPGPSKSRKVIQKKLVNQQ